MSKEARHLGDTAKANIRRAQAAIQKMKLLTEDINAYLQLYEVGIHKSMTDPNAVIESVLARITNKIEQSGARFDISDLPPLPADPLLFSQLMTCLIDNSIKFRKMIHTPSIRIRHSRADEMNSVPDALKDTPYIIISISDNGIGFEEEDAEKIFDLFVKLHEKGKYRGSGIGLAVCKKIMTMHQGFITAEGNLGFGATFKCYFPLRR